MLLRDLLIEVSEHVLIVWAKVEYALGMEFDD